MEGQVMQKTKSLPESFSLEESLFNRVIRDLLESLLIGEKL